MVEIHVIRRGHGHFESLGSDLRWCFGKSALAEDDALARLLTV